MCNLVDLLLDEGGGGFVVVVDFHEEVLSFVGGVAFWMVLVNVVDELVDAVDFEDGFETVVKDVYCFVELVDLSWQLVSFDQS